MKWQLLVIALVCVGGVFAEEMQAFVDQPTTITTACIRNSQLRSSANASIIIYDSLGGVVVPQVQMSAAGNGTFVFTYVFTEMGSYNTRETCDFDGCLQMAVLL